MRIIMAKIAFTRTNFLIIPVLITFGLLIFSSKSLLGMHKLKKVKQIELNQENAQKNYEKNTQKKHTQEFDPNYVQKKRILSDIISPVDEIEDPVKQNDSNSIFWQLCSKKNISKSVYRLLKISTMCMWCCANFNGLHAIFYNCCYDKQK